MTKQIALEIITNIVQRQNVTKENDLALAVTQKAIEKQIQKKPIIGDTFSQKFQKAIIKSGQNADIAKGQSYKCPVCHQGIIMLLEAERNEKIYGCKCKDNFCKKCGQAIKQEDL